MNSDWMSRGWNTRLRDQLDFHWSHGLRPRLEGLTDDEYLWQPAPPPVTTIAWRLAHVTQECFAARTAAHFAGPPADAETWVFATTADEALGQLEAAYAAWSAGVEALGDEGLMRPCGPAEGPFAEAPMADLVLHINRELIHHGAEICLLRDLYLRRETEETR